MLTKNSMEFFYVLIRDEYPSNYSLILVNSSFTPYQMQGTNNQ